MSENKYRVGERFRESAEHFRPSIIEILEIGPCDFICRYVKEDGFAHGTSFRLPKFIFDAYLTHIPKNKKHIRHYFGETWDNK